MTESILESDEGITQLRTRCERFRDLLAELTTIHLEVDAPTRDMEANEQKWIGRMRKIGLHVLAINRWEIGAGVEHVMAPEVRAAYDQMSIVWKDLPSSLRLDEVDVDWWAKEASSGLLATYDHPTPQKLMISAGHGGFSTGESGFVYAQLVLWLGRLVLGYGLALVHLSQVLGSVEDIEPRVTSVLQRTPPLLTREIGMRDGSNTYESASSAASWETLEPNPPTSSPNAALATGCPRGKDGARHERDE